MEVNENTRAGMAMLASTIAGAVFASGSAQTEVALLFLVEEKMLALFPSVEPAEIFIAVSKALTSLNFYRETLGHFDKPEGMIQ
jgi:hypothetical protein